MFPSFFVVFGLGPLILGRFLGPIHSYTRLRVLPASVFVGPGCKEGLQGALKKLRKWEINRL
jgi:hypothetical protein